MTVEQLIFLVLSAAAVLTALGTIVARNPVHSGALLVLSFFNVAGLFVMLWAEFLAVAQVIIYGGAIMVLVVFVVMLVRMDDLPDMHAGHPVQRVVAPIVGLVVLLETVAVILVGFPLGSPGPWTPQAKLAVGGQAQAFGLVLYSEYLFPFVVVSLVLLVAAIGAMALAREGDITEDHQASTISLSRARARHGAELLDTVPPGEPVEDDVAAMANALLGQRSHRGQERER